MRFRDHWTNASINRIDLVSPTIKLFQIRPVDGIESWTAGSNIRVKVRVEDRTEIRTYSLIDIGRDDGVYRIAVKLIEGGLGGSRYMWSLQEGDTLEVSQPHNQFQLSRYSTSFTLVAGGVGVTPLVSMAKALRNSDKPVKMIYGSRTREEAAFSDLLSDWLGDRLQLCIAEESGPLDINAVVDAVPENGELYVCGPIGMLEAITKRWGEAGREPGLLRFETFAASGHYANKDFTVSVPRLNKTVRVAEHQTMLAAMQEAGIEMMFDCKRGECGLCMVDIVENDAPVDHRDVFFSATQKTENKKMCTCVSRSAGGHLVVDTAYRGA